eukprot:TRINITY_DN4217_c0_g1_i1.p1 TRINITY_DN4217_c0_g1~~TRINITY_DN4217_c0_g1_i1.p1  ORF type:complete len:1691 (+),score=237.37 TRINITY_DN4217_c0_g1_i1:166-5073(+)
MEVEFNEDIRLLQTYGYCHNRTCPYVPACPPCDYTDPAICNGSRVNDTCPCPLLPRTCRLDILQFDKPIDHTIKFDSKVLESDRKDFRIHLDPRNGTGCNFFHWNVISKYGNPNIYIVRSEEWEYTGGSKIHWWSERYAAEDIVICPNDSWFTPGTYIVEIQWYPNVLNDAGSGTSYTLTADRHELPDYVPAVTNSRPCLSSHYCLEDDKMMFLENARPIEYFEFRLPKECPLKLSVHSTYAGNDIAVSLTNKFPTPKLNHPYNLFVSLEHNQTLAFSVCTENADTSLYIGVRFNRRPGPLDLKIGIAVSSNPAWLYTTSLTALGAYQVQTELYGAATLECGSKQKHFSCNSKISGRDSDCNLFWPIYPYLEAYPLHPRPSFTFGGSRYNEMMLQDIPTEYKNNKFSAAVMLKYRELDPLFPVNVDVLSAEEFETCQAVFKGRMTDSTGNPIFTSTSFTKKELTCDHSSFSAVHQKMRALLEAQEGKTASFEIRDIQYQLDAYAISDAFFACESELSGLIQRRVDNVQLDTRACVTPSTDPATMTDPCCNGYLLWNSSHCASRQVETALSVFDGASDQIGERCASADCTTLFLQDYMTALGTKADAIDACSTQTADFVEFQHRLLQPYHACQDRYLGVRPKDGIPCFADSECDSGRCNLLDNICINEIDTQKRSFLRCAVENLDNFLVTYMEDKLAITYNDQIERQLAWIRNMYIVNDCSGPYSLPMGNTNRWVLFPASNYNTLRCGYCDVQNCFDKTCALPLECNIPYDSICPRTWRLFQASQANCRNTLNNEFCNRCGGTADKADCLAFCKNTTLPQFCGLCENPEECYNIESLTDQTNCRAAQICLLHDHEVVPNLANCGQAFRCNATCWDGSNQVPCTTESDCLSAGVCSDSIFSTGKCVLPASSYRLPDCPFSSVNFNPTVPTPLGCVDHAVNQSYCATIGGSWVKAAHSKQECDAHGFGCLESADDLRLQNTKQITLKNSEECLAAGGTVVPLYNWQAATWQGGVNRTAQWLPTIVGIRYTLKANQFDSLGFFDLITEAIQAKYGYELKTETKCRYNQRVDILNTLVCSCSPDNSDTEQCFASYDPQLSVALNVLCKNSTLNVAASATNINFFSDSLVLKDVGSCTTVSVSAINANQFKFPSKPDISTFLIDTNSDKNFAYLNQNNATVGIIVGDGVAFYFNGSNTINNVQICFQQRNDISFTVEEFPVPDMLEGDLNGKLTPSDVTVSVNGAQMCVTLNSIRTSTDNYTYVYLPVYRTEDWETQEFTLGFTTGEVAVMSIITALYGGVFIYSIVKLSLAIKYKLGDQLNFHLFWLFAVMSAMRAIYFLLLLNNVIDSSTRGMYVLVELPAFIYFTALSLFVVTWFLTTRVLTKVSQINVKNWRKKLTTMCLAINLTTYAIFVLVIILYETLPQPPVVTCAGRITVFDLTTSQTLSLVYRIYVTVISFLLGFSFMVYGFKIYCQRTSSAKNAVTKRKVFWTTLICSIGVIIECAYLLALIISRHNENILSLVILAVVEAVPIIVVMSLMSHTGRTITSSTASNFSTSTHSRNRSNTAYNSGAVTPRGELSRKLSTSSAIGLESSTISPRQNSSLSVERQLDKDADSTPGEHNLIDHTPTSPGANSALKV